MLLSWSKMDVTKRILAIIPAYNEAKSIAAVIDNIRTSVPQADIIVVNDGSADTTENIAEAKGTIVLNLPYNMGIGGAVQTGYKFAAQNGYDIAVQVDADGQHPVNEIPRLVEAITNHEADMVIGSRYVEMSEKEASFTRAMGKWVLAKVITLLTGQRITDSSSGFRVINQRVICLFSHRYPRDYPEPESIALLIREGLRVKEIPVEMNGRTSGRSSITMLKGIYYVIKVTLAILIDKFEPRVQLKESKVR